MYGFPVRVLLQFAILDASVSLQVSKVWKRSFKDSASPVNANLILPRIDCLLLCATKISCLGIFHNGKKCVPNMNISNVMNGRKSGWEYWEVQDTISETAYTKLRAGKGFTNVKFHKQKMTWSEARKVCQAERGDLVKVDTKQKSRALRKYMHTLVESRVWIGLADRAGNNTYIWTDGSPLVFNNWIPLQPDHSYHGKDEDCVVTKIDKLGGIGFLAKRGWNDVRCSNCYSFICEKSNL